MIGEISGMRANQPQSHESWKARDWTAMSPSGQSLRIVIELDGATRVLNCWCWGLAGARQMNSAVSRQFYPHVSYGSTVRCYMLHAACVVPRCKGQAIHANQSLASSREFGSE